MRLGLVVFTCTLLATTSRASAQPVEPAPTEASAPVLEQQPVEQQPVEQVEQSVDHDQPANQPIEPPPAPSPPERVLSQQPAYEGPRKSPLVAGALSFGLTTAGVLMLATATDIAPHYDEPGSHDSWRISVVTAGVLLTLVGPTSGHIYAEQTWSSPLKWRIIGGGVAAATILPAFGLSFTDHDGAAGLFGVLATLGAAVYVGATVAEIWTAPGAARRHNERLEEGASISIAPMLGRDRGLVIGGRF